MVDDIVMNESEVVLAIQTAIFGLIVIARFYLTSHLACKRVYGFMWSFFAGVLYCSLMVYVGLYVLAVMEIVIMGLDSRGIIKNYRRRHLNE